MVKQDFDYQITVEKWQIDHMTSKGFYLNVDFGIADRGQIFIGAYKVDQLENGDCVLYLKKMKPSVIDSKIMELSKISKLLIEIESGYSQSTLEELERLGVNPKLKYQDIHQELQSEKISRKILKNKFEQTVEEINTFNEIKATNLEENKEKKLFLKIIFFSNYL